MSKWSWLWILKNSDSQVNRSIHVSLAHWILSGVLWVSGVIGATLPMSAQQLHCWILPFQVSVKRVDLVDGWMVAYEDTRRFSKTVVFLGWLSNLKYCASQGHVNTSTLPEVSSICRAVSVDLCSPMSWKNEHRTLECSQHIGLTRSHSRRKIYFSILFKDRRFSRSKMHLQSGEPGFEFLWEEGDFGNWNIIWANRSYYDTLRKKILTFRASANWSHGKHCFLRTIRKVPWNITYSQVLCILCSTMLVDFLSLWQNTQDGQLMTKKGLFWPMLQRCQSPVAWLCCFGPVVHSMSQQNPWQRRHIHFTVISKALGPNFPLRTHTQRPNFFFPVGYYSRFYCLQ